MREGGPVYEAVNADERRARDQLLGMLNQRQRDRLEDKGVFRFKTKSGATYELGPAHSPRRIRTLTSRRRAHFCMGWDHTRWTYGNVRNVGAWAMTLANYITLINDEARWLKTAVAFFE